MANQALAKIYAVVIAIVIVVAVIAGVAYYYLVSMQPQLPAKEKLLIGVPLSLTGINAPGATAHSLPVFRMIVDEYNEKGGLFIPEYGKRLPIELKIYDDKSDMETMLRLLDKLITDDKVDYLLSPWGTAFTFAASTTFEENHFPLIAITCSSVQLVTKAKAGELKYTVLALTQPHLQARAGADLLEHVGFENVGIIYIADLHGIELSAAIYSELYNRNIFPVVMESYPIGVTDLSPLIRKLKDADVDALFEIGYPEDSVLFINQATELGYKPPFILGSAGMDLPAVMVPIGTQKIKGIMHWYGVVAYKTPELIAFAERHYNYTGFYPESNKAQKYASHEMLFKAIEKYGLDREKVMNAILNEEFDTILGKVRYIVGDGVLRSGLGVIAQWQGGEMAEIVWPLEAATADWIPWSA